MHAYKIRKTDNKAMSFERRLTKIKALDLKDRLVTLLSKQKVRVDEISKDDDGWSLDFIFFRNKCGPGKVSSKSKIEGFEFSEGECFGEETAMYYNIKTGYAIIQYNHYGPKYPAIAEYMRTEEAGLVHDYMFFPEIDKDGRGRVEKLSEATVYTVRYAGEELSKYNSDTGSSIGKAAQLLQLNGGDSIEMRIVKNSGFNIGRLKTELKEILRIKCANKIELRGKFIDDVGGKTEDIDLLAQRLEMTHEIEPGKDLRLPFKSRVALLKAAHDEWSNDKIIKCGEL